MSGGPSETFTYGTTDNRLQSAAVTGQPTRTFTHDAAGNITIDDRGAGNTVIVTIGPDNRPQVITVSGTGATTVTYKHNAFGERVSRIEGSATTHFHYDQDGRLIAETDGTGALVREYLWLGDKPLALAVGPAGSATLSFVHADHLERVQKITDAAQAIVWDGQFTPYGRTHAIAGTIQNPLRFPGQWADPAAGYFYNYMRDYDPTLARYLSVDRLRRGQRGAFRPRVGQGNINSILALTNYVTSNVPIEMSAVRWPSRMAMSIAYTLQPPNRKRSYSYASANPQNRIDPRGEIDWRPPPPTGPPIRTPRRSRPTGPYCPQPSQELNDTPLDDCIVQWIDDTKWCDNNFRGRRNIACHAWAKEELMRCKQGLPRQPFRT